MRNRKREKYLSDANFMSQMPDMLHGSAFRELIQRCIVRQRVHIHGVQRAADDKEQEAIETTEEEESREGGGKSIGLLRLLRRGGFCRRRSHEKTE